MGEKEQTDLPEQRGFRRSHDLVLTTLGLVLVVVCAIACSRSAANRQKAELSLIAAPAVNLPWFCYGHDFGKVESWTHDGVSVNQEVWDVFRRLGNAGVRHVTWFLLADGRALAEPPLRPQISMNLDQLFWRDYDAALDIAARSGVGIVWVLLDHTLTKPRANSRKGEDKAVGGGRASILQDPLVRKDFVERVVRPLVTRRQEMNQVVAWIVMNEPEFAVRQKDVSQSDVDMLVDEVCSEIHSHGASGGCGNRHSQLCGVAVSDAPALRYWLSHPTIRQKLDFVTLHHYPHMKRLPQDLPPLPVAFLRGDVAGRDGPSKLPILLGEFSPMNIPPDHWKDYAEQIAVLGYANAIPWSLRAGIVTAADPPKGCSSACQGTCVDASAWVGAMDSWRPASAGTSPHAPVGRENGGWARAVEARLEESEANNLCAQRDRELNQAWVVDKDQEKARLEGLLAQQVTQRDRQVAFCLQTIEQGRASPSDKQRCHAHRDSNAANIQDLKTKIERAEVDRKMATDGREAAEKVIEEESALMNELALYREYLRDASGANPAAVAGVSPSRPPCLDDCSAKVQSTEESERNKGEACLRILLGQKSSRYHRCLKLGASEEINTESAGRVLAVLEKCLGGNQ